MGNRIESVPRAIGGPILCQRLPAAAHGTGRSRVALAGTWCAPKFEPTVRARPFDIEVAVGLISYK